MPNKIVYMIHTGEIKDLQYKCIKSLRKHCSDCIIYLYTFNDELKGKEKLSNFNIIFKELNHSLWDNRRMANKIENIKNLINDDISDNDNVLVLDSDLYFQDDPFKVFNSMEDYDVFITTRDYSYVWSINAGVWGFKNNIKGRKFIDFYINQINNPTWDKLVNFRNRHSRPASLDWWVDQDLLCVINDYGLSEEISDVKIADAGNKYNYCPSTDIMGDDECKRLLRLAIGDPKYKILHLKASLKQIFNISELE